MAVEEVDLRGLRSKAAYFFHEAQKMVQEDINGKLFVIEPVQKIAKRLKIEDKLIQDYLKAILDKGLMWKVKEDEEPIVLAGQSYNPGQREVYQVKSNVVVIPIHRDGVIQPAELIDALLKLWKPIVKQQIEKEEALAKKHQERAAKLREMLDLSFLKGLSDFLK